MVGSRRSRLWWGMVLCIVVAPQGRFLAEGTPKGNAPHRRGIERSDGSRIINVIKLKKNENVFTITGKRFLPGSDIGEDREATIKSLREAVRGLRERIERGLDGLDLEAAKSNLAQAEGHLKNAEKHRPAKFSSLFVVVVRGADEPPQARFTSLFPAYSGQIPLPMPAGHEPGEYTITIPATLKPGPYTVILTPLDGTSVPGAAILGGSDTINIVAGNQDTKE